MRFILLGAIAIGLQGCASIISGTSQNITINSDPEGAECAISRENVVLEKVTTPKTFEIDKSKHDLTVKCELAGHYPETVSVDSEIQGSTWGNIILGGGIGWAVDSARGADNKYIDAIMIRLTPLGEAPPEEGKALIEEKEPEIESSGEKLDVEPPEDGDGTGGSECC